MPTDQPDSGAGREVSTHQPDSGARPDSHARPAHGQPTPRRLGRPPSVRRPSRAERYYLLLGLLLVDIFVIGLAGASKWATFAYTPLTAATLLLALRTSEAHRRALLVAWLAGGLAVVVSVVALVSGDAGLNDFVYFMLFALLLASPFAILRRVVTSRHVTPRLLIGAICVYLMIGLLFTFMYLGVNGVHPDFFKQGAETEPSIYLYFSFITMTTTGYGDFSPGSAVPRVLVVFEAILGQIFLVTTVARLVSLYTRVPLGGARAGDDAAGQG